MLDLLKAAARHSRSAGNHAMPDDRLTFTLECSEQPDGELEHARIEALVGANGFDLFPYGADEPFLLVLTFPDIPIHQPGDYLFREAEHLREALGLVSVVPEIAPIYSDALSIAAEIESVGALMEQFCLSRAESPPDPGWAVQMVGADRLHARGITGKNVRIGQPDTGVAEHESLKGALDIGSGYDFVDDRPEPTDPLSHHMASPGHGTATSSVAAARTSQTLSGSAPEATIVPIRAVNNVVIGSGVAVARAVDHARAVGCQVVTMSLGGPIAGNALRRAIARAISADMIVLAAAGNCVGFVVYPAWDRNVIAVAGVDHAGRAWRGSCLGPAVDVSAPGENVHVARRSPGEIPTAEDLRRIDMRGQGTSYAVALTAGVAALWISHFGMAAIRQEARSRDLPVQELFRTALRQSARRPDGWDTGQMGAGIIDAEALINLPLADIGARIPVEGADFAETVLDIANLESSLQAEASFIASDWSLRERPEMLDLLEAAMPAQPTARLRAAMGRAMPASFPSPVLISEPVTPPLSSDEALRQVSRAISGRAGDGGAADVEAACRHLDHVGHRRLQQMAEDGFARCAARAPALVDQRMQKEALRRLDPLLRDLGRGEFPAATPEIFAMAEAMVLLTGRPAIRVRRDGSEIKDPEIGDWASDMIPKRQIWQALTRTVGRIDAKMNGKWLHVGTGFMLQNGMMATNRHVLDAFAIQLPGTQEFVFWREASIIFDPDGEDDTQRFGIKGVITAGARKIGKSIDPALLDLALLEAETEDCQLPPSALPEHRIAALPDEGDCRILISGYPARPGAAAAPELEHENYLDFWDRIGALYGDEYGVQYMSPGQVVDRPGVVSGDSRRWIFTHDATTLGGNSGSAIILLNGDGGLCGLHLGGRTFDRNYAHALYKIREQADGTFDQTLVH